MFFSAEHSEDLDSSSIEETKTSIESVCMSTVTLEDSESK